MVLACRGGIVFFSLKPCDEYGAVSQSMFAPACFLSAMIPFHQQLFLYDYRVCSPKVPSMHCSPQDNSILSNQDSAGDRSLETHPYLDHGGVVGLTGMRASMVNAVQYTICRNIGSSDQFTRSP